MHRPTRRQVAAAAAYVLVWAALSLVLGLAIFLNSSRTTTLASHDAVLRPNLGGHVVLRTGPVLPDVRVDSGSRVGVNVTLGKTDAVSTEALVERYALIASQPHGPEARVREVLGSMAASGLLRGAALALVPLGIWFAVGKRRRHELVDRIPHRRSVAVLGASVVVLAAMTQPWEGDETTLAAGQEWVPLAEFLGPDVPLPEELDGVEVRGDVTTGQTRRLIESAIDTYAKSKAFYREAAEAAAALDLRDPADDETVVALIADRHDNIGMDAVARAIADAGGAEAVYNAGDDTSTGEPWEAFSLDSVSAAFDDAPYDEARWAVTGNHDHGSFVGDYLADHGWTVLDGEVVDGPADVRLLGVGDPRASGLGNWRDETGLSFEEVADRLADAACAADDDGDRVGTVLVHDANLGAAALERGCVDLVLGGHLHVRQGPTRVVGDNGRAGYSFTTGTTGGAAYALAVGSKIRRPAEVSLVTYRVGRPVGVQAVVLQTDGTFEVQEYVVLALD